MKTRSPLAVLSVLATIVLASPPALAANHPDLAVGITAPSGVYVYDSAAYTFTVNNLGRQNAAGVVLTIALPQTHTSPTVHVMGTLGTHDGRCTRSGTVLTCALGTIVKLTGTQVVVNIALPYSAGPIAFDASATTTTSGETNPGNNSASHTAILETYDVSVAPPRYATNRHCTGTNLTSFFECALYPSSISSFDSVLEFDTSVTLIDAPPGYGGSWSMPETDHLIMELYDDEGPAATLDAWGVGGDCFEGLMTFEGGGPYVAPYEVCLQ